MSEDFSIKVDTSETRSDLQSMLARIKTAAQLAVRDAAKAAYASTQATTLFKNRSGELRGTIDIIDDGPYKRTVKAPAKHARYIESGTDAHPIEAKGGGRLRFMVAGSPRFARKVNHPGTKARPFMRNAEVLGGDVLARRLEALTEEATKSR